MYNTIDAPPDKNNTRESWNKELMRPVRTGSKARAKLPPYKKKVLSVSNASKGRGVNQNAIQLYQRQVPGIPAPLQLSSVKKSNRTRSGTKKKDFSSHKKRAENDRSPIDASNNRSRVVGNKGVTTGRASQQEPNPGMVINLEIGDQQ